MKLSYLFLAAVLFTACNSKNGDSAETPAKAELEKNIITLEDKLYTQTDRPADYSLANNVLTLYLDFAKTYPDDPKSPEYYFKTGELANSIKNPKLAITLFETVRKKYPSHDKAPYALFLQGFIYENELKDFSKAKEVYSQVIQEYPNHEVAEQSKLLLPNVGKSDEELIKEFEEKNKGK